MRVNFEKFEAELREVVTDVKATVASLLSEKSDSYCIGFHLRHVLDSSTPTVAVASSDSAKAEQIGRRNEALGLHTLNHVIDSLLYGANCSQQSVRVGIAFRPEHDTSHAFDTLGPTQLPPAADDIAVDMKCRVPDNWLLSNCTFDTEIERFIFERQGHADTIPWSSPYDGFVCGAQKLCEELKVPNPGTFVYRSLTGAVLQLAEFARVFGSNTRTYLVRQNHSFGCGVGATLISSEPISAEVDGRVISVLQDALVRVNSALEKHLRSSTTRPGLEADVAEELFNVLSAGTPNATGLSKIVRGAIADFIRLSQLFCDEQLEGRPLRFAIVLGHPMLFKHWPGGAPAPLPGLPDGFAKLVHLVEGPEERLIVVPYGASVKDARKAFAIDLVDFSDGVDSHRQTVLWEPALRPAVYFASRYPWAVSAVVGPNSEVRIFARGDLKFYRDGKGWRKFSVSPKNFWPRQSSAPPAWYYGAAQVLLEFCLQLSPIARSSSHGALVLWVATAKDDDPSLHDLLESQTTRLGEEEPEIGEQRRWLTGRSLFRRPEGSSETQLDYSVARLAIRAAMVDGALVLRGPRATVWGFSRQLAFKFNGAGASSGGTKRAAAQAAVECLQNYPGTIAVAVSSDGPLRTFYRGGSSKVDVEENLERLSNARAD